MPREDNEGSRCDYHAYLVRMRRVNGSATWQIIARDVETGDEFPFGSAESLLEFFRAQMTNSHPARGAR